MKIEKLFFEQTNVSSNYKKLKHLMGNRYGGGNEQIINDPKQVEKFNKKVKSLVKSMKTVGYDVSFPIVVAVINGVLYILDGQHRYMAAALCEIPYHFVIKPEIKTVEDANKFCEKLNNSKSASWETKDYVYRVVNDVETYPLELREKYQLIIDCSKKYKAPITEICNIIVGEDSTKRDGIIKSGRDFTVKSDYLFILELALEISLKHPQPFKIMGSRAFLRNVGVMCRNNNITKDMIERVRNHYFDFEIKSLKYDDYVKDMLETRCNYKQHNNRIHLGKKMSGTLM